MKPVLAIAWAPLCRMLGVLALAGALIGGCERGAVGDHCYDVELILEVSDPYVRLLIPLGSGQGDLAGLIDCRTGQADGCFCRVVRVAGAQFEEVLCLHDEDQKLPHADRDDPGDGLFLVVSGFSEWPVPMGLCWDSLSYELWDLAGGLQATFSSPYLLAHIVRHDRFLGMASPCEGNGAELYFEPALYLVDGAGQLLREHTGIGGVRLEGIDPTTRDYILQYAEDSILRGHDADGEELPLVIGEATGCRFAGAQAGVHAFICPEGAGSYSLVVGRSGGPAVSVDLAGNGWGAVGGVGAITVVGLETGRLEVYRYEQERLEILWTKEMPGRVHSVVVGRGSAPLIGANTDDDKMHVFDLQGRPVLSEDGDVYLVGDVGGYVTIYSDKLQTYRISPLEGCARPGVSLIESP